MTVPLARSLPCPPGGTVVNPFLENQGGNRQDRPFDCRHAGEVGVLDPQAFLGPQAQQVSAETHEI